MRHKSRVYCCLAKWTLEVSSFFCRSLWFRQSHFFCCPPEKKKEGKKGRAAVVLAQPRVLADWLTDWRKRPTD